VIKSFLYISLFLISSTVFTSCLFSNCDQILLSDEDKAWCELYDTSQVLIFKSNLGNIDTFTITTTNYLSQCNKFELSDYQYQRMSVVYNKNNHEFASLSIQKTTQNKPCTKTIQIGNLKSDFSHLATEYIQLPNVKNSVKSNYFLASANTEITNFDSRKIKSFNWHKTFGLLQYITQDGEIFKNTTTKPNTILEDITCKTPTPLSSNIKWYPLQRKECPNYYVSLINPSIDSLGISTNEKQLYFSNHNCATKYDIDSIVYSNYLNTYNYYLKDTSLIEILFEDNKLYFGQNLDSTCVYFFTK